MILATFKLLCPEFRTTPDLTVQAFLDLAAKELNVDEIGDAYDEAHRLLTAHKIAISPLGVNARTLNDAGQTTYEVEFEKVLGRSVVALLST